MSWIDSILDLSSLFFKLSISCLSLNHNYSFLLLSSSISTTFFIKLLFSSSTFASIFDIYYTLFSAFPYSSDTDPNSFSIFCLSALTWFEFCSFYLQCKVIFLSYSYFTANLNFNYSILDPLSTWLSFSFLSHSLNFLSCISFYSDACVRESKRVCTWSSRAKIMFACSFSFCMSACKWADLV